MKELTEFEIGWLVGIFEGEGYIKGPDDKRASQFRLFILMTDRDVVDRVASLVGGTVKERKSPCLQPHWKRQWQWTIGGAQGRRLLRLLGPSLGSRRRERAEEVLAALDAYEERVTAERSCINCGESFRPSYNNQAAKRMFCTRNCGQRYRHRRDVKAQAWA